jgi:cysteine desulfurase
LAQEKKILLHSDATQACGRIPIDLSQTKIDLISISAHKMYGPKGVGALYLQKNLSENNMLSSLIYGGQQERGLRAGTLNVPGIVGLGQACEIATTEMNSESQKLDFMSKQIYKELKSYYPKLEWNGHPTERISGQMNFLFRDKRMDQILPRMVSLAMSSGSACSSQTNSVSHVLKSIGLNREEILASVRLSVGRTTTPDDVQNTIQLFKANL